MAEWTSRERRLRRVPLHLRITSMRGHSSRSASGDCGLSPRGLVCGRAARRERGGDRHRLRQPRSASEPHTFSKEYLAGDPAVAKGFYPYRGPLRARGCRPAPISARPAGCWSTTARSGFATTSTRTRPSAAPRQGSIRARPPRTRSCGSSPTAWWRRTPTPSPGTATPSSATASRPARRSTPAATRPPSSSTWRGCWRRPAWARARSACAPSRPSATPSARAIPSASTSAGWS